MKSAAQEEIVLEAGRSAASYWGDLWRYRELFVFLAWRDILVRYKETVVGLAWTVLRPVLAMFAFTLVFHRFAKLNSGDIPYPLLVLAGLLPWQFFSTALSEGGNSLVQSSSLISKIYFPRLIIPASTVVTSLVEFIISGVLFGILMLFYGQVPATRIIFAPAFVLLTLAAATAGGIWISALTVRFRDLRVIVPFIVQFGFFISPVGYSSSIVPDKWRWIYAFNPMAGIIDGFRWSLFGIEPAMYWPGLVLSFGMILILLLSGLLYFRRVERSFADVI